MELTEMQQFALDLLKKKGGVLNTSYLSHEWAMYKHQRISAASRDRFGTTSAAYRTLRRLVVLGLVEQTEDYSIFKLKPPARELTPTQKFMLDLIKEQGGKVDAQKLSQRFVRAHRTCLELWELDLVEPDEDNDSTFRLKTQS